MQSAAHRPCPTYGHAARASSVEGSPDNPGVPQGLQDALLGLNPWAVETDTAHHGYAVAKFSRDAVDVEYVRIETTRRKGAGAIDPLRYAVPRGERKPQKV